MVSVQDAVDSVLLHSAPLLSSDGGVALLEAQHLWGSQSGVPDSECLELESCCGSNVTTVTTCRSGVWSGGVDRSYEVPLV